MINRIMSYFGYVPKLSLESACDDMICSIDYYRAGQKRMRKIVNRYRKSISKKKRGY